MVHILRMTSKLILNAISEIVSGFLPLWFMMLESTGLDYIFYLLIAIATGAAAVAGCKRIGKRRFGKGVRRGISRKVGKRIQEAITRIDYYLYECMRESFPERKERERRWRSKRKKQKYQHRRPKRTLRVEILSRETHKSQQPKGRYNCTKGNGERYYRILSFLKNIPFIYRYLEGDIIMSCASSRDGEDERPLSWDSDSFVIGIDQHSSAAISNNKDHFTSYQPCTVNVVGVDGIPRGIASGKGTIEWWIEDDEGIPRKIRCEKAWYVPSCPKGLLPPQHFARYGNTHREKTTVSKNGTGQYFSGVQMVNIPGQFAWERTRQSQMSSQHTETPFM